MVPVDVLDAVLVGDASGPRQQVYRKSAVTSSGLASSDLPLAADAFSPNEGEVSVAVPLRVVCVCIYW